jgi:hypothetical protein
VVQGFLVSAPALRAVTSLRGSGGYLCFLVVLSHFPVRNLHGNCDALVRIQMPPVEIGDPDEISNVQRSSRPLVLYAARFNPKCLAGPQPVAAIE